MPSVIGFLARQFLSIAGSDGRNDVNQTPLQAFVAYHLADGWYRANGPVITANWNAGSE